MNFKNILHPELILNRRGPESVREFYAHTVREIQFLESGGVTVPEFVKELNSSEQRAMTLMRRWQIDNGKVFHVNRDFLIALSGIERNVNLDYLPERFVGYISFAPEVMFDDEDEVEGAYVYVGPSKYTSLKDQNVERVFWCAYVTKGWKSLGTVCADIKQGMTIEGLISSVERDNTKANQFYLTPEPDDISKRSKVFNTVLNAVMYIHSQEPNVQRVPSTRDLSNRQAQDLKAKVGIKNECTIPITFLNWTYAKQRTQVVDGTWVETFMRWQPCGPGRGQVKLIWVKEHERTYKKDLPRH
jgi:hypothetical protein